MLRCVRHTLRYITLCVRHTLPGYLAFRHTLRDVAMCLSHTARPLPEKSYTRNLITECPPREAQGVLLAKHRVSARLYHAVTRVR